MKASSRLVWACAMLGGFFTTAHADDCLMPNHGRVLHAEAQSEKLAAEAIWLSGDLIRWPKHDAAGHYRLHASGRAALRVKIGEPVEGADTSYALAASQDDMPEAIVDRFRHVESGVTLHLSLPTDRRKALLQAQLILTKTDDHGRVIAATRMQHAGALDSLYASASDADDLGVQVSARGVRFSLWAPTATRVMACIYDSANSATAQEVSLARDPASGIWRATSQLAKSGGYYTFLVDVYAPGVGTVRNRVTDPYAVSLTTNSTRALIANLDDPALKPDGWDKVPIPKRVAARPDMAIYELHVRDFSIQDKTVPAKDRGKYTAFNYPASRGMRHLKALSQSGMTDVHLLPVFDIATIPERGCTTPVIPRAAPDSDAQQAAASQHRATDCFNWGYDPFHFTAPEGSYSTNAADGRRRVIEFRQMVQALHRLNLRVGMDVVYNHTAQSGQQPKSVLDRIVPGYYHRLNAQGMVEQSTCCENTATEHRMMGKLMIDSAITLAKHYKIDSFRFDLMGHQPRSVMEALQRSVNAATGRDVQLIGEGWNFGEVADGKRFVQASQLSLNGSNIGTFSDRGRDAIRGGTAMDSGMAMIERQGFVNGLGYAPNGSAGFATREEMLRTADMVRVGLAGSIRSYPLVTYGGKTERLEQIDYNGQPAGYVTEPGEVVNYVENHDNQTLFDINVYKLPLQTSREDRARVQILALALNSFSQGIAYYHAGGEILRSKSMDRNSYDSGDWFNRLDWTLKDNGFAAGLPPAEDNKAAWPMMAPRLANSEIKPTAKEIAWTNAVFSDLLRIRSSSSLFRLRRAADIRERLVFHNTGPTQNATLIVGQLKGGGYAGARFDEVVYFVNVGLDEARFADEAFKTGGYRLHPAHRADRRALTAKYRPETGGFDIPARTAVVFVRGGRPPQVVR